MNGKRFSENKARKNGFYLALAVCLVAVGIAAWSTYDAVQSYVQAEDPGITVSLSSAVSRQEKPASASSQAASQTDTEDPEAPTNPTTSRQTAGTVTSKPTASTASKPTVSEQAASEVESEPEESFQQETQIPVNAPLYERSSQMLYPLTSKEILKAYSAGAPVYSETMKDWRVHVGTDVEAQAGEEVRACANGQVKQAYTDSMLGNVLLIEHGDYEFSYCGLGEKFLVQEGDIVTKGQVIGTITAVPSESADQPHLHLEVRRDGVYLDPQTVLDGN